ncbi:hypothetical protein [Shimia sediminis]|uniref:sulfotransferase-like domain-containing protein n=1 Tax=Shimia sediminis TaxID=2497945 RepID=UPI000F8F0C47|nr:hypothetical protein [Shimia sediminis]
MNKIIALWSHPRSMSTAMERVMRERGDLDCAHEPFMYDYYVHRKVREMPHFDVDPTHPQDYAGIRDMLLRRADKAPVFFKDMSYYVMPHVLEDTSFSDRLIHAFLIRDPQAAILSYFKLDPNVTRDEIGIEAQWLHFKGLREAGHHPVVIRSEEVRRDPKGTMSTFWKAVGLPYRDEAFDWSTEMPKDWEQVGGWHGQVVESQGIRPITSADLERQKLKFDEAASANPRMRDELEHHQSFYDQLAAFALC